MDFTKGGRGLVLRVLYVIRGYREQEYFLEGCGGDWRLVGFEGEQARGFYNQLGSFPSIVKIQVEGLQSRRRRTRHVEVLVVDVH